MLAVAGVRQCEEKCSFPRLRVLDVSTLSVVVMCVDQIDTRFVERCLSSGVDYIDITAKQSSIDAIERLDEVARRHESTSCSASACPGVTNLLAAHAAQHVDTLTKVDLFLMIGSGDRHGEAAVEWTLANLHRPFEVSQDGQRRVVRGMGEHETVQCHRDRHAGCAVSCRVTNTLWGSLPSQWRHSASRRASSAVAWLARPARRYRDARDA